MADIKKALRVALAERDMKQTDLAKKLDVSPQQVYRWVSTDADVGMEALTKIAGAFGISVSELVALGE